MAKTFPQLITSTFLMIIFFTFLHTSTSETPQHYFSQNLSPEEVGIFKQETLSHLHFYFHDIVSGPNPTAIQVARAPTTNMSSTGFGAVAMIDDPLTVGPESSSKLVGRAQGLYAAASQSEACLLMVMDFVFMEGKYNGSTLSVLGRNAVFSDERDGHCWGSGVFRFARGYAQAKTHTFNIKTGDAIVEYNVYVYHS
ncbi:hypothetical protein FNV43_RR16592 [Rhamnella rubrinervis]|uniref:Dirigent protein n=1 Tax=Rhamnella rubrinervis TaxID=2594499 RepID=A0A8K0GZ40_9ROSA|nr:hypothetical protein FNV43_RR16592 [Rhamnella rubrinervis]